MDAQAKTSAQREDDPLHSLRVDLATLKNSSSRQLEVRGEVLMTRKAFEAMNRQQEEAAEKFS